MSKRKKLINSSSSSEGKIKKKKFENISGYFGDSESNEKKIVNKVRKKN